MPTLTQSKDRRRGGIQPLVDFLHTEAAGGILLVVGAAVALIWANSPWSGSYVGLWETKLGVSAGSFDLTMDLRHWINDGAMAIFFLVVGLEIKRELVEGELSDPRQAALPAFAAVGGMVVPAGLYVALNAGTPTGHGWGVPVATDIALALGVVGLLGARVPIKAKIFLLALAIVDDIGAILIIALAYSSGVTWSWLAGAGVCLALTLVGRALKVSATPVYVVLGVGLWLCLHEAGIHATLAGVIMGLLTPASPRITEDLIDEAELVDISTVEAARETMRVARSSVSVIEWLEHRLHSWSSFLIVPIFALANAGVIIGGDSVGALWSEREAIGIIVGLVIGKPLGIAAATWLGTKAGFSLPDGMSFRSVFGVGLLAGIGFTVSIFVSELAFSDEMIAGNAKLAVLVASVLAAIGGAAFFVTKPIQPRAIQPAPLQPNQK